MDAAIVRWLNGGVGAFPPFDDAVRIVVGDYFCPVVLSLLVLGAWFGARTAESRMVQQKACLAALLAMAFGNLAVEILDELIFRERPFVNESLQLLFYSPSDPSFPSNPAVVSTALAAGLWTANRRLGCVAFAVAAAWALSRVYAGVAYPTDVLGGVVIALAIVAVIVWTLRRIEPAPTLVIRLAQRFHLA